MQVDRVLVTKDGRGQLRWKALGGNNEVEFTSQSYRDRHVRRLIESIHDLFPDATIHVHYDGHTGEVDYDVDLSDLDKLDEAVSQT